MKRRALPQSIEILGAKIHIRLRPEVLSNGQKVCGFFDSSKRVIEIDHTQSEELFWETFAHEVEHVIHWRIGLWQEGEFRNTHEILAESAGNAWGPIIMQLLDLYKPKRKPKYK